MLKKSPENFSLAGSSPFGVFFVRQRAKNCPTMTKISSGQDTHYINMCAKSEAWNAEKWLWPIFGSKVGQSVPIGMKLELDMWHYLLNVYTMFQNDISKHVEKKPGKLRKIKNSQK